MRKERKEKERKGQIVSSSPFLRFIIILKKTESSPEL